MINMWFLGWVILVNVLGLVNVFLLVKAPKKVGETFLFIMIVLAVPVLLPFALYYIFVIHKEKKKD